MSNRHLSRSLVLQTLFEWDFRGFSQAKARPVLERNRDEFAPGMGKDPFAMTLLDHVLTKQKTIDEIIAKAAPEWPIDRISPVDRNILRIGLCELLFFDSEEVPPKVAINESIELAKTYGGENSGRFVNGVLGAVYKELGEPGKDHQPIKKKKVDISKLPVDTLVGAVVYSEKDGETFLALVHDVFGHWTLSKGHLVDGENEKDGTARKVKEEMGIDSEVLEELGRNQYVASDPEKGKLLKKVHYFLARSTYGPLTLGESGGLDDAQWFKLSQVPDLNFYEDIFPIVTKAVEKLAKD